MAEQQILVGENTLTPFVGEVFEKAGMSSSDAEFSAKALVDSDLWGIESHGVLRVPIYVKRLKSGTINATPNIKTVKGSHGFEILDGDDGHGFIVGRDAMVRAIHLADKYNVGVVGAMKSNHFGAAGIYARMAAEKGMVGICMANVVQNMVVQGGSKPIIGNNPIAVAVPTFGEFPFVLDISLSAVAGGKLLLASKKGEKIPTDWATDKDGRPTDDPEKAFAGFLLPMGGHKGFGLALVVDILCGVLTGGAFLDRMKGMYKYPDDPSLTGHFMIAINIPAVMGDDEFKSRMAAFHRTIKDSPMWDTSKEMYLPGEIEHRISLERKKRGIPLPENLYHELIELGRELGVSRELRPFDG
jgi:LDH2 family malate/lactate/ureidoglycolate dehydrogenase